MVLIVCGFVFVFVLFIFFLRAGELQWLMAHAAVRRTELCSQLEMYSSLDAQMLYIVGQWLRKGHGIYFLSGDLDQ